MVVLKSSIDGDVTPVEVAYVHPPAANVVVALSQVIAELPGIGKDENASQQQGGYAYRGIEAITREAAPLFAKHGIVFVPRLVRWERDQITVSNKPWTDDRCEVVYTVYGPGGPDDKIEVGPIPAVGRDNSDKGTNKALTQAFKYALLQVLCIADGKDDADGSTHERDARPTGPVAANETLTSLAGALKALGEYPDAYKAAGYPALSVITDMLEGRTVPMLAADAHAALAVLADAATIADAESHGSEGASGSPASDEPAVGGAPPIHEGDGVGVPPMSAEPSPPTADVLPAPNAAELDVATRACDLCGSTLSKRVVVGEKVRCANASGCEKRVAAAQPGTCNTPSCANTTGLDDQGFCPDHEQF